MRMRGDKERCLAVIGCGAVVEEFYAPTLHRLENEGWSLLFQDASAERARLFAAGFARASAAEGIEEVASQAGYAIVATPPSSHHSLCSRLLDAGLHVLCEKPLVLDVLQARELVARATTAGRRLHVNQTRRWFPASIAARRLVAEGAIGKPTSVSFRFGTRFSWPAKTAFYCEPGLQRNGVLADQGSHVFDLIAWILGCEPEPISVTHDGYAGPETTARLEFSCGDARGEAVVTWLVPVPTSLEIEGTSGRLLLDDDSNRALLTIGGETVAVAEGRRYLSYSAFADGLVAAFLSGVETPSVATAQSVLPSIAFLDRAYQVAAAKLPLVTEPALHR